MGENQNMYIIIRRLQLGKSPLSTHTQKKKTDCLIPSFRSLSLLSSFSLSASRTILLVERGIADFQAGKTRDCDVEDAKKKNADGESCEETWLMAKF